MKILFFNLIAISCVIIAGVLCYKGQDGWGWFLIAGVITSVSPKDE